MAEIAHYFSKLPGVVKQSETGKPFSNHVHPCWGSTGTAFEMVGKSKYND